MKSITRPCHAYIYGDQRERSVFKRDLDDDSDGTHKKSFGIEFETEEEAKEDERSPSIALHFAGQLS